MNPKFITSHLVALVLAGDLASCSTPETDPVDPGAAVYRRQCAECHGARGEGVRDKYDNPLHGDWSVEKLARYIDRTMPEDEPEKCTGADAAAVARFIHGAFYSREARLRDQKPRVEVVRLTNRQYLTAVADLAQSFVGGDGRADGKPGLQAFYYKSKDTNRGNVAEERVDAGVDFSFGAGAPLEGKMKPEEFAIRWHGSVRAEETGEHQFVLRSENGVRLFVNDQEEPLIDAWVSSGPEPREHTATLRLLGGRDYPLRLEFFKFKEKSASVSLKWKPPHGALGVIPARSLNTEKVSPALVVSTPFPADDSSVGYERGVAISKDWDEAVTRAAIETANRLLPHLDTLAKTGKDAPDRAQRIREFCATFVERAFRRPLDDELKRRYVDAHFEGAASPDESAKRVILLALKSPRFLYLGLGNARPDGFEVASRLSFALWDSLPDRELLEAAKAGRLTDPAQVRAQAERLLRDPRARAKLRDFLHHWLQMDRMDDLAKDESLFPGFSPEIIGDLRTSLNLFLDDVAWADTPDYRRFLLSDEAFVNGRLAAFYGVPDVKGDDFVKVRLDPAQRSGVLTHPYLLAGFAYPRSTSPIHRGVFLTRNIVGRVLKPPPMAIAFKDEEFSADLSMRQKVEKLTRPEACQTCHSVINPLGFSLEHYDAVGRYRTVQENRKPVDAVGEYTTDEGETIRLGGARDLAVFASTSEQAQVGFIEQLFHQLVKQPMLAYGADRMDTLRRSFAESGFHLRRLMVDIATVAALHGIPPPAVSAAPAPNREKST